MVNKAISLLKITSVLATSILAQGCVGIVVRGIEGQTFEPARVAEMPAIYAVGSSPSIGKEPKTEDPTTVWLKEHWGQPSQVSRLTRPAQGELWTYDFGRKWCGVMPCIVVPIPLLLPIGRERVVFYIREGSVVKADVMTLGGYQAVAGLGPEGPMAVSGRFH